MSVCSPAELQSWGLRQAGNNSKKGSNQLNKTVFNKDSSYVSPTRTSRGPRRACAPPACWPGPAARSLAALPRAPGPAGRLVGLHVVDDREQLATPAP
eukprot:6814623-Heterocapsa_arctica.AAC.1